MTAFPLTESCSCTSEDTINRFIDKEQTEGLRGQCGPDILESSKENSLADDNKNKTNRNWLGRKHGEIMSYGTSFAVFTLSLKRLNIRGKNTCVYYKKFLLSFSSTSNLMTPREPCLKR